MSDEKGAVLTGEELDEIARLEKEAFRAPWTYAEWQIECSACEGGTSTEDGSCPNPECDGETMPSTAIESPEEYPNGQLVAQFSVPGLSCLADKNGALIVALRNACPALLESARLARLAAELFEQHGEAMADSIAARAREARDMHGAFDRAATLDRAHTALSSTIAAFRKGAE